MLNNIGLFSYGSAAICYALLAIVLLFRWVRQWQWTLFFISAVVTAVWAGAIAAAVGIGKPLGVLLPVLEILHSACWIVFLLALLQPGASSGKLARTRPYVIGIVSYLLFMLIATPLSGTPLLLPLSGLIDTTGRVMLAIIGILLVEQLFRSASEHERWSMKFACLALAGMFVFDFYLYSDAMLFHAVNGEILVARGFVDALLVPLFLISLNRNLKWTMGLGLGVSRQILFHSAALIGCSAYLLIMAAAGYYLRYFGGHWGTVLQMAFLFGAGILLFTVLFSGSARAWLRVFISKNFYQYSYDYREEWIRFTRILSAEGPGLGERAIQAVAQLVESGAGTLFISHESGDYVPSAQWNADQTCPSVPASSAVVQFLHRSQWIIDLPELRHNPEKYDNIEIEKWMLDFSAGWLLIPLEFQGRLFGFILLEQARSKIELNWEVLDVLKIAASQAVSYLAQQESANALMIARQFESFNRMSTFMVHDLKNLVAQLSLMMLNAEKHQHNPEFQKDMLETIDNAVQKMKTLLQKLARGFEEENLTVLPMDQLLKRVVATKSPYEPTPVLNILEPGIVVYANAERLERVIGHILQNAIDATGRDGNIEIRLTSQNRLVVVEVMDSGTGMSEEFVRDKLFSPFVSTKVAGMGIGVFETREYIQQLGGRLEVVSQPGQGTCFRMILPVYNRQEQAAMQVA